MTCQDDVRASLSDISVSETEVAPTPPHEQIQFYRQFSQVAVQNLQHTKDRVIAAQWILALEKAEMSLQHAELLKQLLFVCLHGRLAGVFADPPPPGGLVALPEHHTVGWLSDQITVLRRKDRVPVDHEVSRGRNEYLAVQDVPFFGTQFFFGFSDEPIENWEKPPEDQRRFSSLFSEQQF